MGVELSRKYSWVLKTEALRELSVSDKVRLGSELTDMSNDSEDQLSEWARDLLKKAKDSREEN